MGVRSAQTARQEKAPENPKHPELSGERSPPPNEGKTEENKPSLNRCQMRRFDLVVPRCIQIRSWPDGSTRND
ncbi:hypothetical protein M513_01580 [Trichuris suis]|uniref:Uncharacterized protein n=1 Tax=Trichuris suis TaxID=68888 RepID=A0A085MJT1_9BILA|nr:hypothetical protein M513_01580 [Trichuris suis]